ncbi:TonB-dependent receptor [Flavihumibacter fluvii]|uniref:TonB-dependent receptor n=1 Tax=Flavihumibacter fluvii TaxID=2838157 RepID=UPI001BDF6A84|nr:TonB-dependent receptor [Flavihumibacter fluvii]ULQ52445.1 TonB-dependent receptor [Flavihumibacter fluvii]
MGPIRIVFSVVVSLVSFLTANAQHSLKAVVRDKRTGEFLSGVTISLKGEIQRSAITDGRGFVLLRNLPPGSDTIELSYVGYTNLEQMVIMPDSSLFTFLLEQDARTLNDVVVVASTRGNERIETATTKVEVLGRTEMNEESTLKPGNIASILGDISGIQIQQSSAVTGNANVRIQGLDGRYTQILRDGMPLYGGYSGGFGVLSIPPLDLKQVELIKGSSSTLYGGGAIGGLINLISTKPRLDPELSLLINQTTLKETNINAYFAQRGKKFGLTFFGGQTFQKEVDVDKDGFSDLPKTSSTLIHPTLFFYPSENTTVSLGWSGSFEKRTGGDMLAIADKSNASHPYYEANQLNRNTLIFLAESWLKNSYVLHVKGSFSNFSRDEHTNTYVFSGKQKNYYGELSLVKRTAHHNLVAGLNANGEDFAPSAATPVPVGNFSSNVAGAFFQDTWRLPTGTKIETGIRFDHHNQYGDFLLPRIAVFQQINDRWGARAGFGMGYITPNPLMPQVRDYSIYQLQPLVAGMKAERSYSGNAELNYKHEIGQEGFFFINQAFFITQVTDPIVAEENSSGEVNFYNKTKPLVTKGSDTYIQMHISNWEFYMGYTFTLAEREYLADHQFVWYTPKHRAAATALYEVNGKWRVGLEASYNGYQYRDDNSRTPDYFFMAAMVERKFGPKWSLVLNCENLFDERQSRYETLYTGLVTSPVFKTLWAPIDGRAVNICLRFQPFAE